LAGTTFTFTYNKIDELAEVDRAVGPQLAAVVMEPTRSVDPQPGFLEGVRELCDRSGAILVVDEITAGWRFALGGAHLRYGLEPDIAVFAKTLGNGHPIAAILGRSRVMQAAQQSFISSTYWTEGVGPAAALATLHKMRQLDVPTHVRQMGIRFREGLHRIADNVGLSIKLAGHPCLTTWSIVHPEFSALQTLFTARMLPRGFLSGAAFYPCIVHESRHIDKFLQAAEEVFSELADAVKLGDVTNRIGGRVRDTSFTRLA
jgi:glutamate-1-semialdehyde 2,1-aminomutase